MKLKNRKGDFMNFSFKTNEFIKREINGKENIKFTVGILKDREMSFKVFDVNGEVPYERHLYQSGSITKVFTASLLAKYLEEDKMSLEDSVAKYIPELDESKYYPTLKRLATHTSGLPYNTATKKEFFKIVVCHLFPRFFSLEKSIMECLSLSREKMISLVTKTELKDRSYRYKYSNLAFSLLGAAIEQVATVNYWDLMNDYLVNDLKLKHSFMGTSHPNMLKGYNLKGNSGDWGIKKDNYLASAGAITSTAEDLLAFAKLNIEKKLSYLVLTHDAAVVLPMHVDMGIGWVILKKNPNVIFHSGDTDGFATMLAIDLKKETAVVLLSNYHGMKSRNPLFKDILKHL